MADRTGKKITNRGNPERLFDSCSMQGGLLCRKKEYCKLFKEETRYGRQSLSLLFEFFKLPVVIVRDLDDKKLRRKFRGETDSAGME